ncbi:methyltransferase domain protein [Synechococcus sp. WH 8103]|nr:methyltransferase domain protein [Synechococcus sp. WH 8103]
MSRVRGIKSFLEVGCGTGFVISGIAKVFPALELEASEFFEDGLHFARKKLPQCRFRQLDAREMVDDTSYECIGSFDVIEHIDADECVLFNFNRALRTGGYLLLTVPQHPWLWSVADDYAHHLRRYTAQELRRKVLNAGFRIELCTSFVSLLLPLMVLQRLLLRKKNYNPDGEFKINPLLNSVLYWVMMLELTFLRLGVQFPAGGSLLLLARKP